MIHTKKMIYVNLWYDTYFEKTNAQLKSFRKLGYITHVMTIDTAGSTLTCKIINVDTNSTPPYNCAFPGNDNTEQKTNNNEIIETFTYHKPHVIGYLSAFRDIFKYVINENYNFIYIRRLMSKIMFAAPYIKELAKHVPIVYEIPTYPLDKTYSLKLSARDYVEWIFFRGVEKYFKIVPVVLCKNVERHNNWLPFLNIIDIDNYEITDIPDFSNTINLIAVSNMHKSHCYERLLYALKSYDGKYNIHLTMISSETNVYKDIKKLAEKLKITEMITFYHEKKVPEVKEIAKKHHIGVGRLTYGEKDRTIDTSLKNKDYCAMGLPFVSSLTDLSFPAPFDYHYIVSNDNYDIDLEPIIEWYLNIRKNKDYKIKMYNYAKENLQYDNTAKEILSHLGLE